MLIKAHSCDERMLSAETGFERCVAGESLAYCADPRETGAGRRDTHGTVGTAHDREGIGTLSALPDRVLLRRVSGPGQCQLRRLDHEPGPRSVRVRVRLRG